MSMAAIALLVTLVTVTGFTLFGILVTSRQRIDLETYMVERNQLGSWTGIATIVASAMGVWILFSPPEASSVYGGITAILGYCLGSAGAVALFCVIGPRLRQLMPLGHSLNEYVKYRFGGAMYWLTQAVMVFYMFIYLAAELTAIAKALQLIANVPLGVTALVVITAVFIYTAYGGLRAAIMTDVLQFVIMMPLLVICFGATVWALGGFGGAFGPVVVNQPALLAFNNIDGLRFGATLVIAIVAAEVFNQGNWQRVYACRNSQVVRRAFLGSALLILPMIFISGLLGLMAVQFGLQSDTAFFKLLQQLQTSSWVLALVILLALALVMSTLGTLLNGIASVFTLDLMRIFPHRSADYVLKVSRLLTVVVGLPAIAIAAQGYSVLYLFLIADLVCAAVLVPILYSLYSRQQSRHNAFWSSLIGIAAGSLFFPKPDFSPWLPIPGAADLLHSFAAALLVSTVVTFVWTALVKQAGRAEIFNYEQLRVVATSYSGSTSLESEQTS